jgi:DNA-binding response OmpR family regulator
MQVLLVEDSARLQELLSDTLREAGYKLDVVATAQDLVRAAETRCYDLLIVDLMLPDGDGADVIRALRGRHATVPILIISAKGSVEDRVDGLDAGADDYLIKPFNHHELLARVRALLRRPPSSADTVLHAGNIELDESKAQVRCLGEPVDMRLSERRLLASLIRRKGATVARETLERELWAEGQEISRNAIEAIVSRLRKTLRGVTSGVLIEAVTAQGYRLREDGP